MMRLTAIALVGLLGACSAEPQPSASASDSATPAAPAAAVSAITTIPAALHGRWGLVPADCTSTRGDAKGLLVIDGTTLRFYESVGKLAEIVEAGTDSIRAQFDFSGEGMTWRREQTLALNDGTLIRQEAGPDTAPEPFKYTRCQVK